jgi:hypothetical protein
MLDRNTRGRLFHFAIVEVVVLPLRGMVSCERGRASSEESSLRHVGDVLLLLLLLLLYVLVAHSLCGMGGRLGRCTPCGFRSRRRRRGTM